MNPIPILGIGTQSRSSNVTAQTRVNCYVEQSDDKASMIAYGTPGLILKKYFSENPIRGVYSLGDYFYIVNNNIVYQVNNSFVATAIGTLLTSSGFVDIIDNGLQIMFVDGAYGYTYTLASGVFAQITDAQFPGAVTVTFNNSFFIINQPNSQKFWISASYNGTSWDALDFASAEAFPDNLLRVVTYNNTLLLFGAQSIEFWTNNGAVDFPYTRISGLTIEYGLAAVRSVSKVNDQIIFLAANRLGEIQVVSLVGSQIQKVSTPDIDNIINGYTAYSNATSLSYAYNGHQFYQINFSAGSWLYDATAGLWSELRSNYGRHYSDMAFVYLNDIYTTDYFTGNLYKIDGSTYTDNEIPMIMELTSKHVFSSIDRFSIQALQIDMETGVGIVSGQGSNPQVILLISKDGGHTWLPEKFASIGASGEYKKRARWNRLGQARDWVFKIKISEPVKRIIIGAYIEAA